jgi:archaellum component FlaC
MDEAPKYNPWPFIAADAVLCGAAFLIGYFQPQPLGGMALLVVGALVLAGSIIAVIPFVLNATRKQEAALDERLQQIAALAQATTAAAEQLSIATNGLHTIADSANKAVRHAEQLPQKMQEKIHEFKEQLNEVSVTENEALSQEVNTLRAAETERMESVVTTVRKLSSEFARLEAATRKNVNELTDALSKFTSSAEHAAAEAATAVASARASAEKSLAAAQTASIAALESSLAHAMSELETKIAALTGQLTARVDHVAHTLDEKISALQQATAQSRAERSRPRAVRNEQAPETAPSPTSSTTPIENPAGPDTAAAASPAHPTAAPATEVPADDEIAQESGDAESAGSEMAKPPRKRTARRSESDSDLTLGLDLPLEDDVDGTDGAPASAVSADGATRLLVTSYIGIGNKLFLRGEGPGLSWDKGTPLQFVSIGKWRWETAEASGPIRAKLFRNDQDECQSVGEITIEPGHQYELTAKF